MVAGGSRFVTALTERMQGRSRIQVVCGALSEQLAVERARTLQPDVVIVDINHGFEMGGLDTARAVRRVVPSAAFVIVSPYSDDGHLSAFPSGFGFEWSYVLSESAADPTTLCMAVAHASWSLRYVDPKIDPRNLGTVDRELDLAIKRAIAGRSGESPEPAAEDMTRWHGVVKTCQLPGGGDADQAPEGEDVEGSDRRQAGASRRPKNIRGHFASLFSKLAPKRRHSAAPPAAAAV
jgi:DNA-binding NarL/FixJ family response regulator